MSFLIILVRFNYLMDERYGSSEKMPMKRTTTYRIFAAIISIFIISGCVSQEELDRRKAELAQIESQSLDRIRNQLDRAYGGTRLMTFKYDGPGDGWNIAYAFISNIGGTMVERGSAEFELDVKRKRTRIYKSQYYYKYTAKLIDNDGPNRSRIVVMSGSSGDKCNGCGRDYWKVMRDALFDMR